MSLKGTVRETIPEARNVAQRKTVDREIGLEFKKKCAGDYSRSKRRSAQRKAWFEAMTREVQGRRLRVLQEDEQMER